jgi:hypothetical protein
VGAGESKNGLNSGLTEVRVDKGSPSDKTSH